MKQAVTRLSLGVILACAAPITVHAKTLNPDNPADAVEIMKRAQCGSKDGEAAIYQWTGKVYSRVPGEPDRLLFTGDGMNIRQCTTVQDPVRGTGYRLVSREVMVFTDPKTGEIIRQWTNPWTGETVDVMHIANDPVNVPPIHPKGRDGKDFKADFRLVGPWLAMPMEVPLFYTDPLGGAYQDYVGGQYHAMEIFDFVTPANQILDSRQSVVQPSISWVRISGWMPWMKMRGRAGQMVFNAVGSKVTSFDALPAHLRQEIDAQYPEYRTPPPLDDQRPNDTTWTVFKKWIDAKRAK
jgi:hypothetical protein